MTTTPLTFPPVIDSSMRSEFISCPHSFFRRYIQGLQLPHRSIHLHFGSSFADGIAALRAAFYRDNLPLEDAMAVGAAAIVKAWGDFPEEVEGSAKSLYRCIGALDSYCAQYPPATDHVRPVIERGAIHTEFNFAVPLPIRHPQTGEPLLYSGRFDMLGDMGGLKVIEDGTILRSQANLVAARSASWDGRQRETARLLLDRIAAHKRAGAYREVRTRFAGLNEKLLDAAREKFGVATPFGGPTSSGMLTLHCPPEKVHALASFLRDQGAEAVSVAALDYVYVRDNALYAKLAAELDGPRL